MAYHRPETDFVKHLVNTNSKVQLASQLKTEREKREALLKFITEHVVPVMISDRSMLDAFAETYRAAEFYHWDLDGFPNEVINHINEYIKSRRQ